jgi:hypothetical protein
MTSVKTKVPAGLLSGLGPTETLAGLTFTATLAATLYNIGFFTLVGTGMVSLLTVQDLFLGAAAFVVIALLMGICIALAILASETKGALGYLAAASVAALPVALVVGGFNSNSFAKYAFVLAVVLVSVLYVTLTRWIKQRNWRSMFYLLSLSSIGSFSMGVATAQGVIEVAPTNPIVVTFLAGGAPVSGGLFRVTSSYIFLVVGKDVEAISLTNVRSFTRRGIVQ